MKKVTWKIQYLNFLILTKWANSRLKISEDRINGVDYRSIDIIQSEGQGEKYLKQDTDPLRPEILYLIGLITYVIEVSEGN